MDTRRLWRKKALWLSHFLNEWTWCLFGTGERRKSSPTPREEDNCGRVANRKHTASDKKKVSTRKASIFVVVVVVVVFGDHSHVLGEKKSLPKRKIIARKTTRRERISCACAENVYWNQGHVTFFLEKWSRRHMQLFCRLETREVAWWKRLNARTFVTTSPPFYWVLTEILRTGSFLPKPAC